jgi:hypothetical protein
VNIISRLARKLPWLLAALTLGSSPARAATELWPLTTGNNVAVTNAMVQVVASGPVMNANGGWATSDPLYFYSDSNGLVTMTNLLLGVWTASATGIYQGITPATFSITNYNSTNYVTQNSVTGCGVAGSGVAYNTTASDSLYLHAGAVNPGGTTFQDASVNPTGNGTGALSVVDTTGANKFLLYDYGSNLRFHTVSGADFDFDGTVVVSPNQAGYGFYGIGGTDGSAAYYAASVPGYQGDGSLLTGLPGANITPGTVSSNALNAATKAQLALAGSAVNFSGSLSGNVTGTQGATVVASLPAISGAALTGLTGANVTGTVPLATSAGSFSGNLAGNVTGTQGATVVAVAPAAAITGNIATNNLTNALAAGSIPLNVSSVTTGALTNSSGTNSGNEGVAGVLNATNPANQLGGNGALLTALTGTNIASQLSSSNTPMSLDVAASAFSQWNYAGAVMSYNQSNYDTYNLRCSTHIVRNGKLYVFYGVNTASGGTDHAVIAYASGRDFYSLVPGGVALSNTAATWDSAQVQGPRIFTDGAYDYMYYFGGTTAGFELGSHSIGVAYQLISTNWNPTNWTKSANNPLLTPTAATFDQGNCWRGFGLKNNGLYYLFYNGSGGDLHERIGFATASNPQGPFTKYGLPVFDDTSTTNNYTQDPSILRMLDGSFVMACSLCCGSTSIADLTTSVDLTNWSSPIHVPISGWTGQAQSFELFMDNGPKVMWDDTQNIYLAALGKNISSDRVVTATTNIQATNGNIGTLTNSLLVSTNAKITTLGLGGFVVESNYTVHLHLKADAVTNLVIGSSVVNWPDSGPQALNTTSAGGSAPVYGVDSNGLPWVFFNANNNSMQTASTTTGTNLTIIVCADENWTSANYAPFVSQSYNSGGSSGKALFTTGGTGNDWLVNDLAIFGNGYSSGNAPRAFGPFGSLANFQPIIITATVSASRSRVWLNGVAISTTETAGNVPNTTAVIEIGSAVSAGNYLGGHVREVIILDTAITDADRQILEAYLAYKWNLQVTLPAGTPFANFFPMPSAAGSLYSRSAIAGLVITGTGITNTLGRNATAYLSCTSITSTVFNNAGAAVLTNTTATFVHQAFNLQPGGSITAASGLSGNVIPW